MRVPGWILPGSAEPGMQPFRAQAPRHVGQVGGHVLRRLVGELARHHVALHALPAPEQVPPAAIMRRVGLRPRRVGVRRPCPWPRSTAGQDVQLVLRELAKVGMRRFEPGADLVRGIGEEPCAASPSARARLRRSWTCRVVEHGRRRGRRSASASSPPELSSWSATTARMAPPCSPILWQALAVLCRAPARRPAPRSARRR